MTNIREYNAYTDPQNADTDEDGLNDGPEVDVHSTNPIYSDTDGDLLNDGEELTLGTDPLDADSDGDEMIDGFETSHGCDPNTVDPDGDADGDGISNLAEFQQYPTYWLSHSAYTIAGTSGAGWFVPAHGAKVNGNVVMFSPGGVAVGQQVSKTFYAEPGEELVVEWFGEAESIHEWIVAMQSCFIDGTEKVYPFDCTYRIEPTGSQNSLVVGINDDDDNGDGMPDYQNEVIDGLDDTNDMVRLVFDPMVIHSNAPDAQVYLTKFAAQNPAFFVPFEKLRFFREATGAHLPHTENVLSDIRAGEFTVLVEGIDVGTEEFYPTYSPGYYVDSDWSMGHNHIHGSACEVKVLKIDVEQTETNVWWGASELTLNLTTDSYLGGSGVVWTSTPPGIAGSGSSITFTPSNLPPDQYVVTAYSLLQSTCSDTCTVNVLKVEFDESKVNGRNITQIDIGKYKDYEKCIAIQWDSEQELDLKDYLKIEPSNLTYEEIEDSISWKKDGSSMESSVLNYDNKPNEGDIDDYAINVCSENGTVFDRLIVVVYPVETKTAFDEWCVEYVDTAWVNVLPPVYSRLGDGNSDPEPGVLNQSWLGPNVLNSFYHHEAAFDMRSLSFDGHGHQATYSTTGILIPSGISAGTADFEWHLDIIGQDHVSEDVLPFVWAAQLDGNPVEYAGLNMTYALIRKSSSLDQYFARRPPHTGNQIPPEE